MGGGLRGLPDTPPPDHARYAAPPGPARPRSVLTHRIISLAPKITNKYVPIAATTPFFVLSGLNPLIHVVYSADGVGR